MSIVQNCVSDSDRHVDGDYHIWYQVTCLVEPKTSEKVVAAVCPVFSTKEVIIDISKNGGGRTEDLEVSSWYKDILGNYKCIHIE